MTPSLSLVTQSEEVWEKCGTNEEIKWCPWLLNQVQKRNLNIYKFKKNFKINFNVHKH